MVNEDSTGDVIALQHQIWLLKVVQFFSLYSICSVLYEMIYIQSWLLEQEELSILKRQNVSRSLSFDLMAGEDMRQVQENGLTEYVCEMEIDNDDNSLKNESKGTVRMSNKQVYYMLYPFQLYR